ncbi:MAG: aminoglycoside phosphotransferase family protein [Chloroflexi bacterium]|nr:aminoglycoside phosphotransferase family protein [Chloroflexota bacterium]
MPINLPPELTASITHILQNLEGNSAQVGQVEPWGGGAHNRCYRIAPQGGSWRYFLKVEQSPIVPRTRAHQIAKEVSGITLATGAGVPCPRLLRYDLTGDEVGWRYALFEFIDASLAGEVWSTLSPENQAAIRAQVEGLAARLDSIAAPFYGDTYAGGLVGQHATWQSAVIAWASLALEDAANLSIYSPAELALIREACAAVYPAFTSQIAPAFLHNDMHEFNAFVEQVEGQTRISHIIDFGYNLYAPRYLLNHMLHQMGCWGFSRQDTASLYPVSQEELDAWWFLSNVEMKVFLSAIRFAPDQPYGYVAQNAALLAECAQRLGRSPGTAT